MGTKCKVHESDQHYHATEREVNLVKWNGRDDTTIDRFDGACGGGPRGMPSPSRGLQLDESGGRRRWTLTRTFSPAAPSQSA